MSQKIFSSKITADSLRSESSNILNVFTKTINSLKGVVDSAKKEAEAKQQSIDQLSQEKENLLTVAKENEEIIGKLTNIFNV